MLVIALALTAICGVLLGFVVLVTVSRKAKAGRLRPPEEAPSRSVKAAGETNGAATSGGEHLARRQVEVTAERVRKPEPAPTCIGESRSATNASGEQGPARCAFPPNNLQRHAVTAGIMGREASPGEIAFEVAGHEAESVPPREPASFEESLGDETQGTTPATLAAPTAELRSCPALAIFRGAEADAGSEAKAEAEGEETDHMPSLASPRLHRRPRRSEKVVRFRSPARMRRINTIVRGGARRRAPGECGSSTPDSARNDRPSGSEAPEERSSPAESGEIRAELVTWWAQGAQHVGLDVSREGSIGPARYEGGAHLRPAGPRGGPQDRVYVLTQMESVIVETPVETLKVELQPNEILLFKLHGEKGAQGRRVRTVSQGKYALVCPQSCEISGSASRENCSIGGYAAYVFECGDGSHPPVVVLPTGERRPLERKRAYRLEGNIHRSASDPRPLCLGNAPRLVAPEPFKPGTTVVVGTEGRGSRRRWRCKLYATPGNTELELENTFEKITGGWFFARVYGDDDILLDSLDFLFLKPVKSVEVSSHPVFPGPGGHLPVCAIITHDDSARIVVERNLPATHKKGLTIVDLPPDPECDEVRLYAEVDGKRYRDAPIVVTADRAWFGLGEHNRKPNSWLDRPFELSREDFRPTKTTAIWVKLPGRLVGTPLMAGFDEKKAKKYTASPRSGLFTIPLKDFYDQPELSGPASPTVSLNLCLWHRHSKCAQVVATVQPLTAARLWRACGRSKKVYAVALMRHPGGGSITCNGALLEEFCRGRPPDGLSLVNKILQDHDMTNMLKECSVEVTTYGGTENSVRKCKAVAHSIANVLKQRDSSLAPKLKALGLGGARPREGKFKPDWLA